MPYSFSRLASGSYDVLLDGVIVAGLVRSGTTSNATWTAELLVDVIREEGVCLGPDYSPCHTRRTSCRRRRSCWGRNCGLLVDYPAGHYHQCSHLVLLTAAQKPVSELIPQERTLGVRR